MKTEDGSMKGLQTHFLTEHNIKRGPRHVETSKCTVLVAQPSYLVFTIVQYPVYAKVEKWSINTMTGLFNNYN
jgi:hypothetical protein